MGEHREQGVDTSNVCKHCGVLNHPSVPSVLAVQYCAGCGHVMPASTAAACTCNGDKCACKPTLANKIRTAARKLGFNVGI